MRAGNHSVFYEGESAALERARVLRSQGLGFDRIAAQMNQERIPTRTGRPWHGIGINRMLTGRRGPSQTQHQVS